MSTAPSIAAQICSAAGLGDEARALLAEKHSPQDYLALLVEKDHLQDAIRFLAHALPKREAVWWAWVCARRAAGAEPAPNIKVSLEATEKWIAQPTEDNRRAAMTAAEAADVGTPAGCAGMAAFFSGGSIAPPDVQAVPPGPYLTAKMVSGAVILAGLATEPEKAAEKFRASLDQGLEVVKRIKLW
jgi:hypothetical protein